MATQAPCMRFLETNSLNNILYSAGSDKLIVAWPFPYNGDGVVIAKMPTIVYSLCYIGAQ